MLGYVLEQLEGCKGQWPKVSKGSRVAYKTIIKIVNGEVADPGVSIVQKLADYFRAGGLDQQPLRAREQSRQRRPVRASLA